jgi:YVTN family beta-propeller protein/autotransporter-associated beta strand protein
MLSRGLVFLVATLVCTAPVAAQTIAYGFAPLANDTVAVIDANTRTVVDTIAVGDRPTSAVPSPDGRWVFVTNRDGASVSVIDALGRTVVGTIATPLGPFSTAFSPDAQTAYVACEIAGVVAVIDVATRTVVGAPIGPLNVPTTVAVSPDGLTGYVGTLSGVVPVNLVTRVPGAAIGTAAINDLAVTPDGASIVATSFSDNAVKVISTATATEVATIPVGSYPFTMALSPDGSVALAANGGDDTVSVIDVATRAVVATVAVGNEPEGVSFTPDGRFAFVLGKSANQASVIDLSTRTVAATVPFAASPSATGGVFITPPYIVPATPLVVGSDAALAAAGFRRFVLFLGGTLQLGANLTTARTFVALPLASGVSQIDTAGFRATLTGPITGTGPLAKAGAGTLALGAVNTHTGSVSVSGGTLAVNGSYTGTPITLAGGAVGGAGAVADIVGPSGSVAPGDGIGILQASTVTLAGALQVELAGSAPGTGYDRLASAALQLTPGSTLAVAATFAPATGATFLIATNVTGQFAGLPEGAVVTGSGRRFRISYVGGDGNDVVLTKVNDAPAIAPIAPQGMAEGTVRELDLTVSDPDGPVASVVVTATSSDQAILRDGIDLFVRTGACCQGATRPLVIQPLPGVRGSVTITVTASDGADASTTSFVLSIADARYFLAEGSTGSFFDTDIALANPNAMPAPVTVTLQRPNGSQVVLTPTLPVQSRTTIRADEVPGLEGTPFSTVVTSMHALPLAVERTMRWDTTGYGSHSEKATAGAATAWYFAEGAQGYFSTYFLLNNPAATANEVQLTYLRERGGPVTRTYQLPPRSRTTIDAGADAALANAAFGTRVVFSQPGMAERAMYWGASPFWSGGHASSGATAPATTWLLAEGATGSFFTTFVLLANPGTTAADVTLTYLPASGAAVTRTLTVQPGQRVTRNIALEDASLANAAVATRVESSQPIVVERSQYWGAPEFIEGHNSVGVNATGLRWVVADGRVGGAANAQTYVLVANPGSVPAVITATFLRASGPPVVKTFNVPASARYNIGITGGGTQVPELANESFSVVVESTQPVVVERATYSDAGGVVWAAGANATATPLP